MERVLYPTAGETPFAGGGELWTPSVRLSSCGCVEAWAFSRDLGRRTSTGSVLRSTPALFEADAPL
jgi:hypothetical protein